MNLQEFLSMVALENACSLNSSDPKDYGFDTWREMYDEVSECDCASYCKGEDDETQDNDIVFLIEEMEFSHSLGAAVVKAYNEAAWVLRQAKVYGVSYE